MKYWGTRVAVAALIFIVLYLVAAWVWMGKAPSYVVKEQPLAYLPPPQPERLIALKEIMRTRGLVKSELEEFLALNKQWSIEFNKHREGTVGEFLRGIKRGRRSALIAELKRRGYSQEDAALFVTEVEKANPNSLLPKE